MQDYDKPEAFYLGREAEPESGKPKEELLLYDAKDLVTRAGFVGMTGSGKAGPGIGLLKEPR